jgi:hypothetical protein
MMINWIEEQTRHLDTITQHYSGKEKLKANYTYLRNAIHLVPQSIRNEEALQKFQQKVQDLLDALPIKKEGTKEVDFSSFIPKKNAFKKYLKEQHQIVSKGTYLNQGVVGMPLGLLLGYFVGSMVLGMLIGLTIGLGIRSIKENQAKKDGRLL